MGQARRGAAERTAPQDVVGGRFEPQEGGGGSPDPLEAAGFDILSQGLVSEFIYMVKPTR